VGIALCFWRTPQADRWHVMLCVVTENRISGTMLGVVGMTAQSCHNLSDRTISLIILARPQGITTTSRCLKSATAALAAAARISNNSRSRTRRSET
jgi:hypothetical protein